MEQQCPRREPPLRHEEQWGYRPRRPASASRPPAEADPAVPHSVQRTPPGPARGRSTPARPVMRPPSTSKTAQIGSVTGFPFSVMESVRSFITTSPDATWWRTSSRPGGTASNVPTQCGQRVLPDDRRERHGVVDGILGHAVEDEGGVTALPGRHEAAHQCVVRRGTSSGATGRRIYRMPGPVTRARTGARGSAGRIGRIGRRRSGPDLGRRSGRAGEAGQPEADAPGVPAGAVSAASKTAATSWE